jgi:hypothetical protein
MSRTAFATGTTLQTSYSSTTSRKSKPSAGDKTDEQDWYVCEQPEGTRQWYTTPNLRVDRNTLGTGWWIPSDNQHPGFVEQPGPSSQSDIAQPESVQASGTQTPAYEEFLSAATHHIVQFGMTPLTPETPEAPITSQILDATVAGHSFTIKTETERLSAAVIESKHLSMADPQISTTITQPQNPAPSNGNTLFGAPPEPFDGNRAKAKEYMHSFKRWWTLNEEKPSLTSPTNAWPYVSVI